MSCSGHRSFWMNVHDRKRFQLLHRTMIRSRRSHRRPPPTDMAGPFPDACPQRAPLSAPQASTGHARRPGVPRPGLDSVLLRNEMKTMATGPRPRVHIRYRRPDETVSAARELMAASELSSDRQM